MGILGDILVTAIGELRDQASDYADQRTREARGLLSLYFGMEPLLDAATTLECRFSTVASGQKPFLYDHWFDGLGESVDAAEMRFREGLESWGIAFAPASPSAVAMLLQLEVQRIGGSGNRIIEVSCSEAMRSDLMFFRPEWKRESTPPTLIGLRYSAPRNDMHPVHLPDVLSELKAEPGYDDVSIRRDFLADALIGHSSVELIEPRAVDQIREEQQVLSMHQEKWTHAMSQVGGHLESAYGFEALLGVSD